MPLARFPDVGSVGMVLDQAPHELSTAAWSDVRNGRFADGYAKKAQGYVSIFGTPTVAPYGVFYSPSNTARFFAYFGLTKAYCVDSSGSHTNITRQSGGSDSNYTGTADDRWVGGNLSGILVVTNGVDAPQSWVPSASNDAANLANWPASTTCKSIRAFKNHLVALDVTKSGTRYPYMIKWSHPADPGAVPASWDHTDPVYDAGEQDLGDSYGEVVDAGALSDVMIIWKQNATYAMRYVGAPFIFAFQKVTDQSGILTRNAWCETPRGLVVLTLGDVVLQTGDGPPQTIVNGRNRQWLFDNLHQTYYPRASVVHNEDKLEVAICFPSLASSGWCDKALVWSYATDTWAQRDLPDISACAGGYVASTSPTIDSVTAYIDDDTSLIDAGASNIATQTIVMASASGSKLYALDAGETADGTSITTRFERTGIALDTPERVKLLRGVRPRIDGVSGATVNVYVGAAMDADTSNSPTWSGPYSFTVGSAQKVDCMVAGRFLGVRFESADDSAWRLRSYDLDVETMGEY